jgi:hypothetical protein
MRQNVPLDSHPVPTKPRGSSQPPAAAGRRQGTDRSPLIGLLRAVGSLLPGDKLKTAFYRGLIAKPRRFLRQALNSFYRIDQIYSVLEEAKGYRGDLSILEFGTHHGYAFTKMLYATEYMGLTDRVTVHSFDSFEGLPAPADSRDRNAVIDTEVFAAGQYRGSYEELEAYCRSRYHNYAIHRGYFEDTLTPDLLEIFRHQLPVLLWIDCDYYSSARTVIERMLPLIPSGCVVYFDDYDYNYGSHLTGEARVVLELNRGEFGPNVELVLDRRLGLDSDSVYRLVRLDQGPRYQPITPGVLHQGRHRGNDSALP